MEANQEKLIVEIDDKQIKYAVFRLNNKLDCEILSKKISKNIEIQAGKILDIKNAGKLISEDLEEIEKEVNKIFRKISVVINQKEILCTNITGFKQLNGSKVEKSDLDYILNEAKSSVMKNQEKNSILHILNSNFILDKTKQEKIPLNIFGDHLSLHMTFLSLPKNNLKNINALFDNSDLKIDRIISKPLVSGLDLLNKNKDLKNFAIIHFDSELSSVSLYEDSSLTFLKTFPFGTNSIYRDITQLCLLKKDEIRLIFNELNFNNLQKERVKYLDKKFFIKSDFTKLSVNHLKSIIDARIEEMINYIFNKNKNLNYLDNKVPFIYVFFEDKCVFNNLGDLFKNSLNNIEQNKILSKWFPLDDFSALSGAAELILKGWHKEAIPFTNKRKSVISGFFSRFF